MIVRELTAWIAWPAEQNNDKAGDKAGGQGCIAHLGAGILAGKLSNGRRRDASAPRLGESVVRRRA